MSKKVYGKRIKRSKNIYGKRRSKASRIFGTILLILLVCGLVFAGYFIASAISRYFDEKSKNPDDTLGWQPTASTTSGDNLSGDGSTGITTEPEPQQTPLIEYGFNAVAAPASALDNASALSAYVESAKAQGYTAIVLELKDEKGYVHYKSSLDIFTDTKIVTGKVTLSKIMSIFTKAEITPIIELNTLMDSIGPDAFKAMTYRFESGDYIWLDDYADKGGKQWCDPYQEETADYLSSIVKELTKAGFTNIICSNTIYPSFRPYDETILAIKYFAKDRYKSLVDVILSLNDAAGNGSEIMIQTSAKKIAENYDGFKGSAELLSGASDISGNILVVEYDDEEIGKSIKTSSTSSIELSENIAERITEVFEIVKKNTSGMDIVPMIVSGKLTDTQIEQAKQAFAALGYKNVIVQ